ncbi:MAG: T9SS type A sorting domain-containing protein [Bacteroidetes bacterium]|jgi:hypothetical protein|nr:T9SS type A sorting domain-containing protein [Bacteroidota bacterium]MBT6685324.1 T9SS type A sorting domain-containing protein [Bacteroidota bacterium]MBT7142882.1 T9SS type A sorting domain-containing protein [Bacteroidota bacterium]MBT7490363.1 T9SS type A sorting domain-containing protein [Bacteroidota bacterium]
MKAKYNFLKRLALFSFLTFYSLAMFATTITVGTGTINNTSTGYPAPYGNFWYGAKHQFLILASELSAAGMVAGPINSVAFDVVTVDGSPLTNFEIKAGFTSTSALSTWETGLTSVYLNVAYIEVTGWNTHTFSNPISWDGTSNLIIETCFNNTAYNNNAIVNQSATTFSSTLHYRADAAGICANTLSSGTFMQRPNMQFDGTAASGPPTCTTPSFPIDAAISINVFGNLTWDLAFCDGYYLYFGTDGGGTANPTNIVNGTDMLTAQTYAYSGLTYNTTYYWSIVPYNTSGNATGCTIWSFTTMGNPTQTLPFTEDWELGFIPGYWLTTVGASNGTMQTSATAANTGSFGLEAFADLSSGFTTPSGQADAWVKGQPGGSHEAWSQYLDVVVDLTTATNPALKYFYALGYQYNNNYNNFWVFINDGSGTWTELFATQTAGAATPHTERIEGLASYIGNVVTIRFYHFNKYATNYLYLDDISVAENVQPPSCANLTFPADAAVGLDLNEGLTWSSAAGADGYYLFLGTDNPPTNVSNGIDVGSVTSYMPTGLAYATTYYWSIVSYNTNGSATGCSTYSFTTMNDPTISTFPYLADFEGESAAQYGGMLTNGWTLEGTVNPKWETEDATGANENSSSTGPFYDHTNYGVSGGIYVFLETSGGVLGDAGHMISPPINLSALTNPYLTFYYHMYGIDMGELHIDIDAGSGWVLDVAPAIIGQQHTAGGDAWSEYGVSLSTYANMTVKLRFRGLRGNGYTSDMSLDNISIGEALVQAPACVTYTLPLDSADINLDAGYPTFSWNAASGADGYYFTLNGTSVDVGNVTSYIPVFLDYSMTYTWSVEPYNAFGTASACDQWMFTTQMPFGGCMYTIELLDDYGDGWNGGTLDISLNGSVVLSGVTLASGAGPELVSLMVNNGDAVSVTYTEGSWGYENSYNFYDADGILAFSDGIGGVVPTGGSFSAVCPTPCDYTISLTDDYGDGWNGGALDVSVNGSVSLTGITLASGAGPETYIVSAFDGDLLSFAYTPGSWGYENAYTVTDGNGVTIFSDGVGGVEPAGGSVTVSCGAGCMLDADFTYSDNGDLSFDFVLNNLYASAGYTIDWDFGDGGTTSNVDSYTYTYVAPGTYDVTCTVSDPNDTTCFDAVTYTITASILPGSDCANPIPAYPGTNAATGVNQWFVYNPTLTGDVNITTCISGQLEDTRLEVYASCGGTYMYFNDDAYCTEYNYASDLNFSVTLGETYYLFWDDYWGPGAFDFIITETIPVYGCTDINSINYDPLATIDDGSCIPIVYGCTDTMMLNYDPLANMDDGSCVPFIYGCTDPTSFNFDPLANTDDGSCVAVVYGCLDTLSLNYNPLANTDDGTCVFPQECVDATYYGIINSPAVTGVTTGPNDVAWWSFTLDDNYVNVVVSLCGSGFNTILEVWDNCGAMQYIAFNDDDFVACGIGNNSQITIPELSTGTYYAKVYGYYNSFGTYNLSITGDLLAPWPVNISGTNHTILIPNQPPMMVADITIDGQPIEIGDFIGVFYTNDNGDLACGGLAEWTGVTTSIAAFGYDGLDTANIVDGFIQNEVFTWKLYKTSTGEEFDATATYLVGFFPNTDLFFSNGMSGIGSLTAVSPALSQFVELAQGWSIISTFMNPADPSLEAVFAPVISDVVIVKNGSGMVYWPQYLLNTIGSLTIGEGYQVKMNTYQMLEVTGTPVVPELAPISIPNGWSYLGYLRQSPANIATMLAPIVSDITIVKNGIGLVYWPLYGLNAIGDIMPGQGYQIKTTAATILTYPANTANAAKSGIINTAPVKYSNVLNTGNSMILGIPVESWTNLPVLGDEIGVFNSSNELIGSTVYTGENIAIAVWGDDFTTENTEAISDGEKYTIKLWSNNSNDEQNIEVIYWIEGSENFESNGISVVGKLALSENVSYALNQNIPNPFAKSTKIDFYLPEDTYVQINVYNVLGELLENVVSNNYSAGSHSVEFFANDHAAGSYFYKIVTDNFVATKQMSISK